MGITFPTAIRHKKIHLCAKCQKKRQIIILPLSGCKDNAKSFSPWGILYLSCFAPPSPTYTYMSPILIQCCALVQQSFCLSLSLLTGSKNNCIRANNKLVTREGLHIPTLFLPYKDKQNAWLFVHMEHLIQVYTFMFPQYGLF